MEACEVQIEGEMPTVIRMIMSIQRDFVTAAPGLPSKHIEIVKILNILIVLILSQCQWWIKLQSPILIIFEQRHCKG